MRALLHDHLWSPLARLNIEVKPSSCPETTYYNNTNMQSKERARDNTPWQSKPSEAETTSFGHNLVSRKWVVTGSAGHCPDALSLWLCPVCHREGVEEGSWWSFPSQAALSKQQASCWARFFVFWVSLTFYFVIIFVFRWSLTLQTKLAGNSLCSLGWP